MRTVQNRTISQIVGITQICLFTIYLGTVVAGKQNLPFTNSAQSLDVPSLPSEALALGDLDLDGDLDVFVVNSGSPARIWLNDGSGSFQLSPTFIRKEDYLSFIDIALEDFDEDQDLDVWMVGPGGATRVLFNDGSGHFLESDQVFLNTSVYAASGDLDGDGDIDVWSGRQIWLNNGTGIFGADKNQVIDANDVQLGDLDGDGDLDAWVIYQRSSIWLNEGAGNFQLSHTLSIEESSAPWDVALGDVDGDRDLDAIEVGIRLKVGENPVNKLWLNDGQARFVESPQIFQRPGNSVSLGDLDGDEDLDIWISSAGADEIWLNAGNGQFRLADPELAAVRNSDVVLGDIDNDGDLDAVSTSKYEGGEPGPGIGMPNVVWQNDGQANFQIHQTLGSPHHQDIALGDLDNDGDLDAFIANGANLGSGLRANQVWRNDGHGQFHDSGQFLGNFDSRKVALADLDGDGDLDAWVANTESGDMVTWGAPNRVYLNNGKGFFMEISQEFRDVRGKSVDVELGDLDSDGDIDALVMNQDNHSEIWMNDGSGHFMSNGQTILPGAADVSLGDLDGDGDLDALTVYPAHMWINNGKGLFVESSWNFGFEPGSDYSVNLEDLDGDLDIDVLFTSSEGWGIWINIGDGAFQQPETLHGWAGSPQSLLCDTDGDNDLDLFSLGTEGNRDYGSFLWINDGKGGFRETGFIIGSTDDASLFKHSMECGDLDGDGDYDLITVDWAKGIQVWINGLAPEIHSIHRKANIVFVDFVGVLMSSDQLNGDYFPIAIRSPFSTNPEWSRQFFRAR